MRSVNSNMSRVIFEQGTNQLSVESYSKLKKPWHKNLDFVVVAKRCYYENLKTINYVYVFGTFIQNLTVTKVSTCKKQHENI